MTKSHSLGSTEDANKLIHCFDNWHVKEKIKQQKEATLVKSKNKQQIPEEFGLD